MTTWWVPWAAVSADLSVVFMRYPVRIILTTLAWLALGRLAADTALPVAVVPFGNLSDYRGRLLDQRAAAALSLEFAGSWSALNPLLVQQTLEDLGVPWPPETSDLQRAAQRLNAALVVTGVVRQVQVQSGGAQVTLYLEILEPLSGEIVAKGQGTGKSESAQVLAVDERVEQALQKAARAAVGALTPPAEVGAVREIFTGDRLTVSRDTEVRLSPKTVLLLLGATEGASEGPRAAAVIEKVTPEGPDCRVLARRGEVVPGIRAWAVGRLP